jgi:hypothetical protein
MWLILVCKSGDRSTGRAVRLLLLALLISACEAFLTRANSLAQQPPGPVAPPVSPIPITGGQGLLFLSQFANPALVGSLYLTPAYPLTGFYPLYPGFLSPAFPEGGIAAGPVILHPHMGVAEMYTDNVFRTNTNKQSDFFHTLSPGIQAQLPFADRHMFLVDYRTNIQYYERNPSNNVQDQTASGRFRFDFPGGLKLDLQGEHKLGHDPRGSAVDIQALEVNKWTANSVVGQAEYLGAQAGLLLRLQSVRWNYLNNNQALIRDRLSNYASLTFLGNLGAKTYALANVGAGQEIYDENKNLDSAIYLVSGGLRWELSALTYGEIQAGYQYLKFSNPATRHPGSVLDLFQRDRDAFSSFFLAGNLNWTPTPLLLVSLQGYRTIQQTAVAGTLFFVATGVNLSLIHQVTDQIALTANLGYEVDDFSGSLAAGGEETKRSDTLKNIAVGVTYRAVEWVGASFQYVLEDRSSAIDLFAYRANTFTVAVEALF